MYYIIYKILLKLIMLKLSLINVYIKFLKMHYYHFKHLLDFSYVKTVFIYF